MGQLITCTSSPDILDSPIDLHIKTHISDKFMAEDDQEQNESLISSTVNYAHDIHDSDDEEVNDIFLKRKENKAVMFPEEESKLLTIIENNNHYENSDDNDDNFSVISDTGSISSLSSTSSFLEIDHQSSNLMINPGLRTNSHPNSISLAFEKKVLKEAIRDPKTLIDWEVYITSQRGSSFGFIVDASIIIRRFRRKLLKVIVRDSIGMQELDIDLKSKYKTITFIRKF